MADEHQESRNREAWLEFKRDRWLRQVAALIQAGIGDAEIMRSLDALPDDLRAARQLLQELNIAPTSSGLACGSAEVECVGALVDPRHEAEDDGRKAGAR